MFRFYQRWRVLWKNKCPARKTRGAEKAKHSLAAGDEREEGTPTVGGVHPPEEARTGTDKKKGANANDDGRHIGLFRRGRRS